MIRLSVIVSENEEYKNPLLLEENVTKLAITQKNQSPMDLLI